MKVKRIENVLNGFMARGMEKLNIIDIDKMNVPFCGKIEDFKKPPSGLEEFQRNLLNSEVKKVKSNGIRLDIFI